MNNTIFYLIGHPDVAKADVASMKSRNSPARGSVDSQDIYDPIFNLVEHEHPADMPDAVWDQVDAVRAAVLKTIETISPKDWNFVFTHAGLRHSAGRRRLSHRSRNREAPRSKISAGATAGRQIEESHC